MTVQEEIEEKQRFETQARRDLQDIRALKEFVPFNRYFMRRLVAKRDDIAGAFRNAEPKDCSKDEREILRRILIELDALVNLTTDDAGNAKAQVARITN